MALLGDEGITVVFDKGNPSKANFTGFAQGPGGKGLSFVSSLSLSHHPDLGDVPLQAFSEVDPTRWPGLLAFRTEKTVYGAKRWVVVTYNPALAEGQRNRNPSAAGEDRSRPQGSGRKVGSPDGGG